MQKDRPIYITWINWFLSIYSIIMALGFTQKGILQGIWICALMFFVTNPYFAIEKQLKLSQWLQSIICFIRLVLASFLGLMIVSLANIYF